MILRRHFYRRAPRMYRARRSNFRSCATVALVADPPITTRPKTTRLLQHRGVAVDTGHLGRGKTLLEDGGHVAGAAAEIDDPPGRGQRHLAQQVERRAQALVGKPQILRRVPRGGGTLVPSTGERNRFNPGSRPYD